MRPTLPEVCLKYILWVVNLSVSDHMMVTQWRLIDKSLVLLLLILFDQVVRSVDIAFLDGCFYSAAELPGRDITQIPHPLITDTAQRLGDVAPKHVVMLHMNHSNPCYRDGPERRFAVDKGLDIGQQGDVYEL